jgi:Tfp pilus assembly protein PilV
MASVLLIVAMVPILRALTKAHMFSSEIERKTQSLVFAQNKLDEIRARSVYNWSSFTASNVSAMTATTAAHFHPMRLKLPWLRMLPGDGKLMGRLF